MIAGTDCIVDVRLCNTDAKSYQKRDPEKVLLSIEKIKKKKYSSSCLAQCRHFSPFILSVDGLLGHEADCFLKRIASRLSRKWRQPYSVTCNHVRLRVNIAAIRATHLCLRGSRIPPSRISKRPAWEDSAGLCGL